MGLKDRLHRLEGGVPRPRCPACVSWAPTRVVYLNDWQDAPREPQPPERCERWRCYPARLDG